MINKHKSNKIKENSNTVRHLNNGTDHRHSKSCCDQSSPARWTNTVTQTTPDPMLLTWGGWPCEKYSPHPWSRSQTRSYRAYQVTQTPFFSNPLMLPFDTQVCHERQICLRFRRILKVTLEMAFSTHCTLIWKLNRIFRTRISKVANMHLMLRSVPVTAHHWAHRWGKIVQWCMKAWSR